MSEHRKQQNTVKREVREVGEREERERGGGEEREGGRGERTCNVHGIITHAGLGIVIPLGHK